MDIDTLRSLPNWPRSLGEPEVNGQLRVGVEDFRVEEIPLLEPSGEGSHMWLQVEKRGANTDWVAGQLAIKAACSVRDVGFAGMKDRHAVTTQWFSLPASKLEPEQWLDCDIPDVRVLKAVPHPRKLKRGVLRGNRFSLVVRGLEGNVKGLQGRLEQLKTRGLPNYFGPQRFGHGGNNVWRAARWLSEGGRLPRAKRSIYLSAARSFLFNEVLAERVRQDHWNALLDGEVVVLDGSHSVFVAALPNAELEQRCSEFDLHPSGPLPGDSSFGPERVAAEFESSVLEPYTSLIDGLKNARVNGSRRSLRLRPNDLEWVLEKDHLAIRFSLPPGAYATTVIDELVSTQN